MAVMKRYGHWYVYFRPFKDRKIGVKLDVPSKTEAKAIEVVLTRACRTGNYGGLDQSTRDACVRMFQNQQWELPPELGAVSIKTPREEMTLWRAVELTLKYPEVMNSANRERHEQAFVHLVEYFGKDFPVKSLWIPEVKIYQMERTGQGAAASTVNKERAALSRMFQVLTELRHVDMNPARLVKPLPEKLAKREVYIGADDFHRILDCVPTWYRPIAETAYFTGMRKGEILGLTRGRLKLDCRMVILGAGDVKERSRKRVPIHRDLVPVLERVLKVAPLGSQAVFHRDGEPITHKDQVRWCWDRKVIKLDFEPFPHFHDLRHSWKTNARRSGMHPEIERAIMGHSGRGKGVHEGYGRISDAELIQAIDGMSFDHGETEIVVARK